MPKGGKLNMGRKIWAFVAFNLYAAFLISAFQENTAYLFDVSLIKEMKLEGDRGRSFRTFLTGK